MDIPVRCFATAAQRSVGRGAYRGAGMAPVVLHRSHGLGRGLSAVALGDTWHGVLHWQFAGPGDVPAMPHRVCAGRHGIGPGHGRADGGMGRCGAGREAGGAVHEPELPRGDGIAGHRRAGRSAVMAVHSSPASDYRPCLAGDSAGGVSRAGPALHTALEDIALCGAYSRGNRRFQGAGQRTGKTVAVAQLASGCDMDRAGQFLAGLSPVSRRRDRLGRPDLPSRCEAEDGS